MTILEILNGFIDANLAYYKDLQKRRSVHQRNGIDANELFQKVHLIAAPVFVLSSGRAGTLFLSDLLEQHSNVNVQHAPHNELIYYSKYAYENQE